MKWVFLVSIYLGILITISAQREHVHSNALKVRIHDATYLNSFDGRIVPVIRGSLSRYRYQWNGPDGFVSTDTMLVDIKPGIYTLHMSIGECLFMRDTIEVFSRTGVYHNEKSFVVARVHPNPFPEDVEILVRSNFAQRIQVEVFDANGRLHTRRQVQVEEGENSINLNLSSAPAGIYVLNFCNDSNCKLTERVMKLY